MTGWMRELARRLEHTKAELAAHLPAGAEETSDEGPA